MSVFDLKGGGGNGWNYSDQNKPGYMEMIEGTVVEISNPQSINYGTKKPETWPDGNPKRNLRLVLRGRSGQELSWTFAPKSKAAEACLAALDPQGTRPQVSIEELLGKFIRIQTQAGVYNAQNPRPWWITVQGDGEANMVRGLIDLSNQQAPTPAPQQQTPAPTPLQQAQVAAQQAVANQNFQQANAAPPVTQQVQQAVANVANQVPVEAYGSPAEQYYSEDIPF